MAYFALLTIVIKIAKRKKHHQFANPAEVCKKFEEDGDGHIEPDPFLKEILKERESRDYFIFWGANASCFIYTIDNIYSNLLSKDAPTVEILEIKTINVYRIEGRLFGYIMAFVCDRMEEELNEVGRLFLDFPYWPTLSGTIFQIDFLKGGVYIPNKIIPVGVEEFQANPVALHNIYTKMTEEEKNVIKEMKTMEGLVVMPSTSEAGQLEKGVHEGMIIYLKHLPKHTLIENVDVALGRNN